MELNRRQFLKLSGASAGGVFLYTAAGAGTAFGAGAPQYIPLHKKIGELSTICPYDGSGCGFIVASVNGRAVNIEGDPDHPINRGASCAKGSALRQLGAENPRRLTKPLYRKPGSTQWEEKSWDWTLDQMAQRIKGTRDANWTEYDGAYRVNRTEAIASVGGSALDNEECYLLVKMLRGLGSVYVEHHARI